MRTKTPLPPCARFRSYARFESVDPARNRFRTYTLAWQPVLWGGGDLVLAWGRIGCRQRSRAQWHADREEAQAAVEEVVRHRMRHGYSVVEWE